MEAEQLLGVAEKSHEPQGVPHSGRLVVADPRRQYQRCGRAGSRGQSQYRTHMCWTAHKRYTRTRSSMHSYM
eukprot:2548875-Rhodomonas_salina.2